MDISLPHLGISTELIDLCLFARQNSKFEIKMIAVQKWPRRLNIKTLWAINPYKRKFVVK